MRRSTSVLLLASVLLVGGCTPDPEPSPTGSSSSSSSPSGSSSASADGAVTVESEHFGADLTLTVHPIEVSGDAALMTIDVTMADDAPEETSKIVLSELFGNLTGGTQLGKLRMVDLDAAKVWWPATDADGSVLTSRDGTIVTPGETVTGLAAFGAPGDATSVDVLLPYFGFAYDVPVVEADGADSALTELGVGTDSTFPSADLEAFTAAYDDASRASVEGEEATVTLASDVLFATDEFALTDAAAQVVDAAAGQIAAASAGGEVSVIGHTDDVGSDAYNQDLSVRRAESVAARLAPALGAGFTVRTEGRGESEPAVPGSSAEARAANRRVEIRFTAQAPGQAIDVGTASMPAPTGAVGSGAEPVAAAAADGKEYEVAAVSVERQGAYLVGTLSVTRTQEGRDGPIQTLFGPVPPGASGARNFGETVLQAGAFGVSLLGESSRFFPIDYVTAPAEGTNPPQRQVLADTAVAVTRPGEPTLVTIVWPDTGQDTVTIDVDGRFRITDVPVEG